MHIRFIILIEDILLSVLRIKKSALAAPTFDDMLSCLLVDFWGVDLLRSCFLTGWFLDDLNFVPPQTTYVQYQSRAPGINASLLYMAQKSVFLCVCVSAFTSARWPRSVWDLGTKTIYILNQGTLLSVIGTKNCAKMISYAAQRLGERQNTFCTLTAVIFVRFCSNLDTM